MFKGNPKSGSVVRGLKDESNKCWLSVEVPIDNSPLPLIIVALPYQPNESTIVDYDIEEITSDNFLDFDIDTKNLKIMADWLDTGLGIKTQLQKIKKDADDEGKKTAIKMMQAYKRILSAQDLVMARTLAILTDHIADEYEGMTSMAIMDMEMSEDGEAINTYCAMKNLTTYMENKNPYFLLETAVYVLKELSRARK